MPLADGFVDPSKEGSEYVYDLSVAFCPKCHMVQLVEVPDRERMFHGEYAYYSSSGSRVMREHFARFAKGVLGEVQGMNNPFILEIGGNDGVFLCRRSAP
jgi:methylation protein EvaC